MTENNKNETGKLARGAKWVIRQLLLELETRNTEVELFDAEKDGYVIFYRMITGKEDLVDEFAGKLSIGKKNNRLEVQHGS